MRTDSASSLSALVLFGKGVRRWQQDSDLAGVRDPAALAKLPAPERAAWQELWQSLQTLLDEVSPGSRP